MNNLNPNINNNGQNNNALKNGYIPNNYYNQYQNQNQNQQPNQNIEKDQNVDSDEKKRKKKQKIIIAIIITIVVLPIVVLSIVYLVVIIYYSNTPINKAAKPIIYLYPEEEIEVSVRLGKPEKITCSYPKYGNGWDVIAKPDGTLIDKDTNRVLYSLYWEGEYNDPISMDEGFVVKGEDTSEFLENKLAILGLNEKESEELIIYWLPIMEKNEYNFIRFATAEEINEIMPLEFSKEPDSVIRVFMQFKEVNKDFEVKEQQLETPEREGFVVVEWGGTEIKGE